MSAPAELAAGVRLVRSGSVVESEVDGEIVALNAETAECYGLNGVGSRVWRLLAEPVTAAEIRDALLAEYDVDAAQCDRAVARLLADLLAEGLIERAEA